MKKKVGLYGGTFNPVHFGHLNLAIELKEKQGLDEVWILPARLSPLRQQEKQVSAEHRFKMAELAFGEIPGFFIKNEELIREAPSYTIDTIRIFKNSYPEIAFFLLMGEDTLANLHKWKDWMEILQSVHLLIGTRNSQKNNTQFSDEFANAIKQACIVTSRMEISASNLRERLANKRYCGHLCPSKVLDYIYENQLYFEP